MQAFLNDEKVRAEYIGRVKAHAVADEIVQGTYWENGKGCAVGCTIHSGRHADYEKLLGIPRELAHLQDFIFETLPAADAKKFPLQFLTAIRVGADLSRVWDKFHVWLLLDEKDGLVALPDIKPETVGWIRDIAVLYSRSAEGTQPSEEEKTTAEKSARAARAARAAWDAWAAWAARDARDAWDARAAWAARDAWAAWDAWDAVKKQRDQLLKLLAQA